MKTIINNGNLKEALVHLFREHESMISRNDTPYISKVRYQGFGKFTELDLPNRRNELWKNTDLADVLNRDYTKYLDQENSGPGVNTLFTCDVHNFETDQVSFLNGWHMGTADDLKTRSDGVIVGSMATAFRQYPELISRHYGKYADPGKDLFQAMNTGQLFRAKQLYQAFRNSSANSSARPAIGAPEVEHPRSQAQGARGDVDEVQDPKAREDYKQRRTELDNRLEYALDVQDNDKAEQIRDENDRWLR